MSNRIKWWSDDISKLIGRLHCGITMFCKNTFFDLYSTPELGKKRGDRDQTLLFVGCWIGNTNAGCTAWNCNDWIVLLWCKVKASVHENLQFLCSNIHIWGFVYCHGYHFASHEHILGTSLCFLDFKVFITYVIWIWRGMNVNCNLTGC